MGNFTRDTFDRLKHYVGVRLQQGVPIIDADWNEQEDIRKYELRSFLKWFVGSGVPKGGDGFRIYPIDGGGAGTIVLTSNRTEPGFSAIVVNTADSTAADALGFGPGNDSASRTGSSPARLTGDRAEPFTLGEGMTFVVSTDGLPEQTVTFQADDFVNIGEATADEVVAAIGSAMDNLTLSVGEGNDFRIRGGDGTPDGAGRCLVDGWEVVNERDLTYSAQPLYDNSDLAEMWGVEPLEPIPDPTTHRTDTVYLDVWEREVDSEEDFDHLVNPAIGIETCVRLKREWVVRVAVDQSSPPDSPPDGHVYYPLARLTRTANEPRILPEQIADMRRTGLSLDAGDIDATLYTSGDPLISGDVVRLTDLLGGLRIKPGVPIDPTTVGQATCFVTVEYPSPEEVPTGQLAVYTAPFALSGETAATESEILWQPMPGAEVYLNNRMRHVRSFSLSADDRRVLTRLVLKGNLISAATAPPMCLSSGDRERWFWLIPPPIDFGSAVVTNLFTLVADGFSGGATDFGKSVGISGKTAVVSGGESAYVFTRDSAGNWILQDELNSPGSGHAVAISGDTIACQGGSNVYVYVRDNMGNWTLQPGATTPGITGSIAVGDNIVVVGRVSEEKAYVFARDSAGTWAQQAELTASGGQEADHFGESVAINISGDTIVVGVPFHKFNGYNKGAAYVFVRDGVIWTEQSILVGFQQLQDPSYSFGTSVAISGDTILIGASGLDSGKGAAYVFVRNGMTWTEQAKLTADDGVGIPSGGSGGDQFGHSVAISGDIAVVGAWGRHEANIDDSGAVYVFVRDSAGTWVQQAKLTAGGDAAEDDNFGCSVAISEDTAVVGVHHRNSAYVFLG
jgi:hypothetical protein